MSKSEDNVEIRLINSRSFWHGKTESYHKLEKWAEQNNLKFIDFFLFVQPSYVEAMGRHFVIEHLLLQM